MEKLNFQKRIMQNIIVNYTENCWKLTENSYLSTNAEERFELQHCELAASSRFVSFPSVNQNSVF